MEGKSVVPGSRLGRTLDFQGGNGFMQKTLISIVVL